MNLLQETLDDLKELGLCPENVDFVTDGKVSMSWKDFVEVANFDYDEGFGGNEIYLGLKIVGDNWWLERREYDGSEWWEYKKKPNSHLHYGECRIKEER